MADIRSLDEGDQITVSITHQIQINGDNSWVRYEASSKVRENETAEDAAERVHGHVDSEVIKSVVKTVETVRKQ